MIRDRGIAATTSPSILRVVSGYNQGTTFLPLPFALSKRLYVQTLRLAKKFTNTLVSKRPMFFQSRQLSYSISLPCSFCLVTQLENSFIPSFLPLQSYGNDLCQHQLFLSLFPIQYTKWLWMSRKPLLVQTWLLNYGSTHYLILL